MSIKRSLNLHTVMFFWVAPVLLASAGICAYLTYCDVYDAIFQGFNRKLSAAANTTAAFFNGDDHTKLMDLSASQIDGPIEENELYKKYSIPMKRIMDEGKLTYHYTIVLKDKIKIAYGVDATVGEDHSFIGSEEENPPEEAARLWRAYKNSSLSVSPIQQLDTWGQLKIANAPIKDSKGETVALTGADVNISVIDKKTRAAFLQVLGAGILSIILAGLMTWYIARKLAIPLQRLKSSALKIGGGDLDEEASRIDQPELKKLGSALETLGQNLQSAPLCVLNAKTSEYLSRFTDSTQANLMEDPEKVAQSAQAQLVERVRILQNFKPFRSLSAHELLVVAEASFISEFAPGAIITTRGSVPSFVLLVEKGSVSGDFPSPFEGLAGIESILDEKPLNEDLKASEIDGARCLVIQKEHFFTMIHECPGILAGLIESQLGEDR